MDFNLEDWDCDSDNELQSSGMIKSFLDSEEPTSSSTTSQTVFSSVPLLSVSNSQPHSLLLQSKSTSVAHISVLPPAESTSVSHILVLPPSVSTSEPYTSVIPSTAPVSVFHNSVIPTSSSNSETYILVLPPSVTTFEPSPSVIPTDAAVSLLQTSVLPTSSSSTESYISLLPTSIATSEPYPSEMPSGTPVSVLHTSVLPPSLPITEPYVSVVSLNGSTSESNSSVLPPSSSTTESEVSVLPPGESTSEPYILVLPPSVLTFKSYPSVIPSSAPITVLQTSVPTTSLSTTELNVAIGKPSEANSESNTSVLSLTSSNTEAYILVKPPDGSTSESHTLVISPPQVPTSVSTSTKTKLSPSEAANQIAKIEAAIQLNKQTEQKLLHLAVTLRERLQECNEKLEKMKSNNSSIYIENEDSFRYVNCGKPYFKDKLKCTPPHNDDTLIMQQIEMYDYSSITSVPTWTINDKCLFLKLIIEMSKDIRRKEIESNILLLKQEKKNNRDINIDGTIKLLKKEIDRIKNKTLKEIALPITEEYDWEFLANKFKNRHSSSECQNLWKLYLHPSINKDAWSKDEHLNLQKLASNNKFQNWDDIANKLGTNRTGYQCFVYYRTNKDNTFTHHKWTKEEEEYLKRLIDFYKEGSYIPWGKVATSMVNRTKMQVYNKYKRLAEQRKGRFLAEEDAVILTFVNRFGPDFKKMTHYLPGRSSLQLRTRYQIIAKKRVSTVWTVEEDETLLALLANQETPYVYSDLTKHLPGKNRIHIRTRYLTLLKWMKTHPDMDISEAPRRASRRLAHGRPLDNLKKAIDNLNMRIVNKVKEPKCNKVTKNSSVDVIEDAIMAILATEMAKDQEANNLQEYKQIKLPDNTIISAQDLDTTNLRKILILFKSRLNKSNLAESEYCKLYPDLINGNKDVCLMRMKSYSKKDPPKTFVKQTSDIFGNNRLRDLEYVLPPHYATITGCRQILTWLSNKDINNQCDYNIDESLRKNRLLNEHFAILFERFKSLFLWPMLLSNQSPEFGDVANENNEINRPLPLPVQENDDTESDDICEVIDLDDSDTSKE